VCASNDCFAADEGPGNPYIKSIKAKVIELKGGLRKNPNDFQMQFRLAVCRARLHEYREAIAGFSQAINLSQSYLSANRKPGVNQTTGVLYLALSYENRASTYVRINEYQKAVGDFGRAIKIRPKYPPNYRNRAIIYERLGNQTKAKADYESYNGLIYLQQHKSERPATSSSTAK